jgi:hypothetical protein
MFELDQPTGSSTASVYPTSLRDLPLSVGALDNQMYIFSLQETTLVTIFTKGNLRGLFDLIWTTLFGRFGHPLSAKSSYGSRDNGWPNGGICPLCHQQQQTASHILLECCYSICIWNMVKDWLGLVDFDPNSGIISRRWKLGGPPLHFPTAVGGSPLPPFSCLSIGNFEKRGMLEPSTTRAQRPLLSSKR